MNKPLRLVIVGGVAGGASAAARARRLSEKAEIIVFERGPDVSFANCGLPYYVGGEIASRNSLLLQTPKGLKQRFNLEVRTRTEVTAIDRANRRVHVREVLTRTEYEEAYDALILSTGAAPLRPPIPGIDRAGHFPVRNVPDVDRILEWLEGRAARRVVVVGAGYVGLEMVEQLKRRHLEVTLVEALPQVMSPLDPEMAAWLQRELKRNRIALHLADPVTRFDSPRPEETAAASVVVLESGCRLPADAVILGLGVRPEVDLARNAGLELGPRGGLKVDDHLRTNDPHIWAVGDAVEVRDAVTGAPSLIPLAGPANRQGRIAADNILGRTTTYSGTWGTAILRLFKLTAACTGANEKSLRAAGIPHEAIHLHPPSHASYYPGATPIAMKILFSPSSGALLGAQLIGTHGVDKRIDVLATALKAGMTVHDLAELELAYAPPFGSAKDPVNLAGMAAQNVLVGDVKNCQWTDLASPTPDQRLILDVRSRREFRDGSIPSSIHIPLHELRSRVHELPRDKEIVVSCETGQRSYFACRFLTQRGFKAVNLTGSIRTWKTAQEILSR